ncbi:MAG: peptide deformylase [Longispora sp.]|nr:peptide deformylase [Longispora sp. (in: high G+C Gram-positive bacteria)]
MTKSQGAARRITHYGEPVLHRPCQPVTVFDDNLKALVEDMFASMYAANGVGLAANQIGVDARVFIVDCPDATDTNIVAHVINPILELPDLPRELDTDNEGCLSVPGEYAEVSRPSTAIVTGVDVNGNPVRIEGTGTLARCLQHETDHLNGILYVDRLPQRQRKDLLTAAGLSTEKGI